MNTDSSVVRSVAPKPICQIIADGGRVQVIPREESNVHEGPRLDTPQLGAWFFIYPLCGAIQTMPGLPARSAFMDIDLDGEGRVTKLSQSVCPRKAVAGPITGSV